MWYLMQTSSTVMLTYTLYNLQRVVYATLFSYAHIWVYTTRDNLPPHHTPHACWVCTFKIRITFFHAGDRLKFGASLWYLPTSTSSFTFPRELPPRGQPGHNPRKDFEYSYISLLCFALGCAIMFIVRTRVPQKNRKEDLVMRKVLSRIGACIAVLGFLLFLGAVGGIDCETLTWSQFWGTVAYTLPMMIIGGKLSTLYTWQ